MARKRPNVWSINVPHSSAWWSSSRSTLARRHDSSYDDLVLSTGGPDLLAVSGRRSMGIRVGNGQYGLGSVLDHNTRARRRRKHRLCGHGRNRPTQETTSANFEIARLTHHSPPQSSNAAFGRQH